MPNKLLKCYNMFPSMFSGIDEMIDKLDDLHDLGFNSVWANPLQKPTEENNHLSREDRLSGLMLDDLERSIYSMQSETEFNPIFMKKPDSLTSYTTEEYENKLREFTAKAKKLGISPIFDIVLNHLAPDHPLLQKRPEWFKVGKREFKDAISFDYLEIHAEEIIALFWEPFIEKYIRNYGFGGARIDCAKNLSKQVRAKVYSYIRELNPEAIIFEEMLFSDMSPEQSYYTHGDAGATHITGSAYYSYIDWHGGFVSRSLNNEEFWKHKIVEGSGGGVVQFTGNHDKASFLVESLNRILEIAPPPRSQAILALLREEGNWVSKPFGLNGDLERVHHTINDVFLYPERVRLISQLDSEGTEFQEVRTRLYHRFLSLMFAGSGGYYMLSGDESLGSICPYVFTTASGINVHDNFFNSYNFLESMDFTPLKENLYAGLKRVSRNTDRMDTDSINLYLDQFLIIAKEQMLNILLRESQALILGNNNQKGKKGVLQKLLRKDVINEAVLAHPYVNDCCIAHVDHVIKTCLIDEHYLTELKQQVTIKIKEMLFLPDSPLYSERIMSVKRMKDCVKQNTDLLFSYIMSEFQSHKKRLYHEQFRKNCRNLIEQSNKIIDALPNLPTTYWCEMFSYPKPDAKHESVFVAVKFDGPHFEGNINIVVVNYIGKFFLDIKFLTDVMYYIKGRTAVHESEERNIILETIFEEKDRIKLFLGRGIDIEHDLENMVVCNLSVTEISEISLRAGDYESRSNQEIMPIRSKKHRKVRSPRENTTENSKGTDEVEYNMQPPVTAAAGAPEEMLLDMGQSEVSHQVRLKSNLASKGSARGKG